MTELGIAGGPVEARESYGDQVVRGLLALATTGKTGRSGWLASACSEIAAAAWSRALSCARVAPEGIRTAALDARLLAVVGRRLARAGEGVWLVDVRGGRVELVEASYWTITGGPRSSSWLYTLTLTGPTTTETITVDRARVFHPRYAWYVNRPWLACSPADFANAGAGVAGGLDVVLSREIAEPHGYVWETGDSGDAPDGEEDPNAGLRADLAALRGGTALLPSLANALGAGRPNAPRQTEPIRIGANPPDVLRWLASESGARMLAVYGLHPSVVYPNAAGQVVREAARLFGVHMAALAKLVSAAASEALDAEVTIDVMADGRPNEIATLSRAVSGLVSAGVPLAEARSIVGV